MRSISLAFRITALARSVAAVSVAAAPPFALALALELSLVVDILFSYSAHVVVDARARVGLRNDATGTSCTSFF
jgi:hypothetical protein